MISAANGNLLANSSARVIRRSHSLLLMLSCLCRSQSCHSTTNVCSPAALLRNRLHSAVHEGSRSASCQTHVQVLPPNQTVRRRKRALESLPPASFAQFQSFLVRSPAAENAPAEAGPGALPSRRPYPLRYAGQCLPAEPAVRHSS